MIETERHFSIGAVDVSREPGDVENDRLCQKLDKHPDLREVVDVWVLLSDGVRAEIMRLVRDPV